MEPIQSQPFIKNEDDRDDLFEDDEEVDGGSYKPRPALSQHVTLMRTLAYLMKGLDAGVIDVDPDYQREVVWTADRMTGLINSLMENYYIPPIILNRKENLNQNDSGRKYTMVCVDGKQRLSSVRAFIQGMIPCHDYKGDKWWFCANANQRTRRKVLPESVQKQFLAKEFVSFEYCNLSTEQEEDLFARVQKGVQLTLAEKMRASTGPWQETAKMFVDDFPVIVSLLKDRSRAKDFQIVLGCFSQIIEVQHPTAANGVPGLKTNFSALPRFMENKHALDDGVKSHLRNVFTIFNDLIALDAEVFTNVERKLKGVQTFAPIEMVSIAVLISMYSDERNDRLLLGDIQYLRNLLRETFVDLRMNTTLWKFIWNYIDNLEQVRGATNGNLVDRSARVSNPTQQPATHPQPTPASPSAKRGRPTTATKPTKVAPGSVVSKADSRQAKRPRTDAGPLHIKQELDGQYGQYPPFPTASGASSPRTSSTTKIPAKSHATNTASPAQVSATQASAQTLQLSTSSTPAKPKARRSEKPNPGPARSDTTTSGPSILVTPAQARQNRISELNSHRAPVAQMESSQSMPTSITPTPQPPMMLPYHNTNVSVPRSSSEAQHPQQPPSLNHHLPFGVGRYISSTKMASTQPPASVPGPSHMGPQAQPHSTTPAQATAPPATIHTQQQNHRTPAPSRSKSATSQIPQHDGTNETETIDLTSDTEQERQDLLSSFRGKAINEQATSHAKPQKANQVQQLRKGFPNDPRLAWIGRMGEEEMDLIIALTDEEEDFDLPVRPSPRKRTKHTRRGS